MTPCPARTPKEAACGSTLPSMELSKTCQIPERSGFPSAVRGIAGAAAAPRPAGAAAPRPAAGACPRAPPAAGACPDIVVRLNTRTATAAIAKKTKIVRRTLIQVLLFRYLLL